jgi:hypothetical protein
MSTTIAEDFDGGISISERVETVKNATLRVLERVISVEKKASTARSVTLTTITPQDPWDDIFGRFNDDPSWADFPRWLDEQYNAHDPE